METQRGERCWRAVPCDFRCSCQPIQLFLVSFQIEKNSTLSDPVFWPYTSMRRFKYSVSAIFPFLGIQIHFVPCSMNFLPVLQPISNTFFLSYTKVCKNAECPFESIPRVMYPESTNFPGIFCTNMQSFFISLLLLVHLPHTIPSFLYSWSPFIFLQRLSLSCFLRPDS